MTIDLDRRSAPDHKLDNLRKGRVTSMDRARLKRDLKDGRTTIVAVLQDPPDCARRAQIRKVLLWAPGLGDVNVDWLLDVEQISPLRHLERLTDRERLALQLGLRRQCPSQWDLWGRMEATR